MPGGRPTAYTTELGNLICDQIAEGVSLTKISAKKTMPGKTTIYRWRRDHSDFRVNYARAREDFADSIVDECLDIADSADLKDCQLAKLRIDTRKWCASKFNRAYTDKTIVDQKTTISYDDMDEDELDRQLEIAQAELEQSEQT